MMNKKKLDHLSYGITKSQAAQQTLAMEMMNKLIQQSRQNNSLLRQIANKTFRFEKLAPISNSRAALSQSEKQSKEARIQDLNHYSDILEHQNNGLKTIAESLQRGMSQIAQTNKKLYEQLIQGDRRTFQNLSPNKSISPPDPAPNNIDQFSDNLLKVLSKKQKKSYNSYGIISEIMPFSDKREMKVRFRVTDLLNSQDINNKLEIELVKLKTTQWVGMVFRATASICWNMLLGGSLSFEEVKVLFTQNIIYNFIELMNDLQLLINEEKRAQLTQHVNNISRDALQFLCKQYPQTKIEAPNISLRKAIPLIENQGQIKFDIVAMVSRDGIKTLTGSQSVQFAYRQDKDYSIIIMKTINYIIDKTDEQYDKFQRIMTGIFQQIYLPKDKRNDSPSSNITHTNQQTLSKEENQYREKVKSYSNYLIGRKIAKNTPKYTDNQIQYGVFFVKAPSVLRIITKWLQELWQFALQPVDDLRSNPIQIKDHKGRPLNISTKTKTMLFEKVSQRVATIKQKIEALRIQCYRMELMLTNIDYISEKKQTYLSGDQMSVGKYCSNLRNAISSFVCSQLSKIMYYLLLIPLEIEESDFRSNDEELKQQALKHLSRTNLVTLKIFDLLRCKCRSNEEQIIHIVEALKQLQKDNDKFEIVRVKDRLNQGTRDILINAQYDGGLVWEIQLAVTSHVDKKQDLLDKYNHFLYQLKRAKLGPLSECVSIWGTLEQRSTYFQQQHSIKNNMNNKCIIEHKKAECHKDGLKYFMPFKRPIICNGCKEYYSIPLTSLLNSRCQECKVTYCGQCFYISLSDLERKQYMFQNFSQKRLMSSVAFQQLIQYNNFQEPFPFEGFFIKKKFLNRQLSFYKIVRMKPQNDDNDQEDNDQFPIVLSQIIVRDDKVDIRRVHHKQIKAKEINGKYYLKSGYGQLKDLWIYYFKGRSPQKINFSYLQKEMKDPTKSKIKYLNVLFQPNYMNELKLFRKQFQKVKLLESMRCIADIDKYQIAVYNFPQLVVMVRLEIDEKELQSSLIKKQNRAIMRSFLQKKVTTITMEQSNLTDELHYLTNIKNIEIPFYLQKIQKLYLAGNKIADIQCIEKMAHLQILSISKNKLSSLKGVQKLTQLNYIKFDNNKVSDLSEIRHLVNLTYLSANSNNITILTGIQNLPKLSTIALSGNNIKDVNLLSDILTLKRIYLRQNPLTDIEGLKDINFGNLFIGGTQINPMDIAKFKYPQSIRQLSMKDINMKIIPKMFDKMSSILQLKLNKNNIKKIQNLEPLVNLIVLDLSDNQIEKIENLSTLINLEIVKLKRNNIRVVQGIKGFFQSLKTLELQDNPLNDLTNYLMYEDKLQIKLKYSESRITEEAKKQLKRFTEQITSRTDSDN